MAWESARETPKGLPATVQSLLATHELTAGAELVIGLPELQVDLPGGGHASQTDLWALFGTTARLVAAAFEAKAGETLGDTVAKWITEAPEESGKPERLQDIAKRLGFVGEDSRALRYRLLHRSASATALAKRLRAGAAVMVVHSFNEKADRKSWGAFQEFGAFMRAPVAQGKLALCDRACEVPLLLGWIADRPADEARLQAAI